MTSRLCLIITRRWITPDSIERCPIVRWCWSVLLWGLALSLPLSVPLGTVSAGEERQAGAPTAANERVSAASENVLALSFPFTAQVDEQSDDAATDANAEEGDDRNLVASHEGEAVGRSVGAVNLTVPGPRPPQFSQFEATNRAAQFSGGGARLEFDDFGERSPFDFENGDTISFATWVRLDQIAAGANVYLVGKGRTHRAGFPKDNQNWAFRLREADGAAHVSFLFADDRVSQGGGNHWHRWTSMLGFLPGAEWHHVALSYRFGEPDSLQCWVDGVSSEGAWDMGGATRRAPHVDNDQVWVASSMGGNAGNSFQGSLDDLRVMRGPLSAEHVSEWSHREGGRSEQLVGIETVPAATFVPGVVRFEAYEGLASHARWYASHRPPSEPVAIWEGAHFFLHRMPYRYDDWGIRDSWRPAAMVRATARMRLEAGTHRLLLRSRGLARLWADGQVVLRTPPHAGSTDGHNPVDPLPEPPLPGLRRVGFGDHETVGELQMRQPGEVELILEMIVGGKPFRVEPGEALLAIESAAGDTYWLLGPDSGLTDSGLTDTGLTDTGLTDSGLSRQSVASDRVELTDVSIEAYRRSNEQHLDQIDDQRRRELASSQDAFWERRHRLAREVFASRGTRADADWPDGDDAIDFWIDRKIAAARERATDQDAAGAAHFHEGVLPILQSKCVRCHGEKSQGGLKLDGLSSVLAGGDSGDPAVVPGDPEISQLMLRVLSGGEDQMPPGEPLDEAEIETLRQWIADGAAWPEHPIEVAALEQPPVIDDAGFLRRAYLDIVGVVPTDAEVRAFLQDDSPGKRSAWIDRLLDDPRYADHWVSYWQDALAENPNPLKPSLNNTGPFRWFLYEQLRDGQPLDRMVTELVMLRGSEREGGSAGFGFAADNDAPMAARSMVLASAFLGVDLQCARCHDSPYSRPTQSDLFALAGMLAREPQSVPSTSSVAPGFFDAKKERQALIEVTLPPGQPVSPTWPFTELTGRLDAETVDALTWNATDSRERLAAYLTSAYNERFAQVVVNRIWQRLMGVGLVEPVQDWEGARPSHPRLLAWLADDFVRHGYDAKHVIRRIMRSSAYQRCATDYHNDAEPESRYFAAPSRRRMSAEQIVDSLFAASETPLRTEEITFDPEARRPPKTMISLGRPEHAWQFATLSNERDRPSLNLPRAQAVVDVLTAFGWTGSRQNPVHRRASTSNVLQPGVLANGTVATWVTRASVENGLGDWAIAAPSVEALAEKIYLRFLGRLPTDVELGVVRRALSDGFDDRVVPADERVRPVPQEPLGRVSWSNHLASEANSIQIERGRRAERGPAADPRLLPAWREAYEDVIWAAINSPEFIWIP